MRGILTSHILLSQKPDPRRCKSYTLIKMRKRVEYFLNHNVFGTPLIMTFSLLLIALEVWAISFFSILWNLHVFHSFSFFSFAILRASCVSLFFSIAPFFFLAYEKLWRERLGTNEWSFYFRWTEKACFCVTLSVRVSIFYMWVFVNLDHGCMTRISIRVTTI